MTLRVVVVDDEDLAREGLRLRLASEPDVVLVGEAADAPSALRLISECRPDLAFLDVRMPGPDGLELAASIPPSVRPWIVYLTAHGEYALDAFGARAVDYLIKPVPRARLRDALQRVRELPRPGTGGTRGSSVRSGSPGSYMTRLPVRRGNSHFILRVAEIDAFEAAANYVRVWSGDRHYLIRATMTGLAGDLDPSSFVRVHRSTIVNVGSVKEVRPHGADYRVILANGREFRMSRTYRGDLLEPA